MSNMPIEPSNKITIVELILNYQSLINFAFAYESKGFLVPDPLYLSWQYILEIVTGQKKLIKLEQL